MTSDRIDAIAVRVAAILAQRQSIYPRLMTVEHAAIYLGPHHRRCARSD